MLSLAEQIDKMGGARNDGAALLISNFMRGIAHFNLGEFVSARTLLEQCLSGPAYRSVIAAMTAEDPHVGMLVWLGVTLAHLGYVEQGRGWVKEAMSEVRRLEALDNLDAILDVPGIDGVYVGPGDLGFSLGMVPKLDREEPEVLQIYERLIRETNKRGLYAGIHCASPVYAGRMIRSGFRLVTIANDSGLLAKAARESVAGVWAEVGDFR